MAQVKRDDPPSTPAGTPPAAEGAGSGPQLIGDDRIEYRANPKIHLAEAGKVALGNWIGRIGSKRVRVYRGAPADKLPAAVKAAMAASGVTIGTITYEELGIRTTHRGARIIAVNGDPLG